MSSSPSAHTLLKDIYHRSFQATNQFRFRLALGCALGALGESKRWLALLGEAEGLARALADRARVGRVLADMAVHLGITGDWEGAIAAGRQVLELAAELGDMALQGEAFHTLGLAYGAIGDLGRAAELLRWS